MVTNQNTLHLPLATGTTFISCLTNVIAKQNLLLNGFMKLGLSLSILEVFLFVVVGLTNKVEIKRTTLVKLFGAEVLFPSENKIGDCCQGNLFGTTI